jgi:RNA polymerase sigma-70 factor (ECF subfamily)
MPKKIGEEKAVGPVDRAEDNADDRSLVQRALEGEKDAYGDLVLKYQKRLFRFIYMMLGRTDITEDIVQEAFVKGYLALASFDLEKRFYPWIATIARNLALNHIKREEKERPVSEYDDLLKQIPDDAASPLDRIIDKENDKKFARAVMALPPAYRSVFVMRTFEKMSYEDIARELNISLGTVDSRLHRARQKLMQVLKDYL